MTNRSYKAVGRKPDMILFGRKESLIFFLFLLLVFNTKLASLFAQKPANIDGLSNIAITSDADTIKANCQLKAGDLLKNTNPGSSLSYYNQALEYSIKTGNKE